VAEARGTNLKKKLGKSEARTKGLKSSNMYEKTKAPSSRDNIRGLEIANHKKVVSFWVADSVCLGLFPVSD